jgi:carbon starvation protein CstA
VCVFNVESNLIKPIQLLAFTVIYGKKTPITDYFMYSRQFHVVLAISYNFVAKLREIWSKALRKRRIWSRILFLLTAMCTAVAFGGLFQNELFSSSGLPQIYARGIMGLGF